MVDEAFDDVEEAWEDAAEEVDDFRLRFSSSCFSSASSSVTSRSCWASTTASASEVSASIIKDIQQNVQHVTTKYYVFIEKLRREKAITLQIIYI